MTKTEIINRVIEKSGLNKSKAGEAVETIITLLKDTLGKGEPIILRKFGSFNVRTKKSRIGRNPKTGQEADISPRKVVSFKSGKYLRHVVNIDSTPHSTSIESPKLKNR
ncbi:MAG: integration host factor subunit alpha [Candidatus Tectomicrobia bacterium]|uniref:Integration host factor subunit alpha n=1 Tax=Tectimicrobiota bacterium TaxID=2528274 RepID=A0A933GN85_UNCTE|nr:integration host factor subunit alpha [Candidatus Tectomicrobia bacterium]